MKIELSKPSGFTLIELMIVVAIIGLLSAIAYPSYTDYVTETRRADGMSALSGFANAMERYYTTNGTYRGAIDGDTSDDDTSAAPPATLYPSSVPLTGGTVYYNITAATNATQYLMMATPTGVQAGDGRILLSSINEQCWANGDDAATAFDDTDCEDW